MEIAINMQHFDNYKTFEVKAVIARIEDKGEFLLDVAVRCIETGDVFEFCAENVSFGYKGTKRANLNLGENELSIPIRPPTRPPPPNWTKEEEWFERCKSLLSNRRS